MTRHLKASTLLAPAVLRAWLLVALLLAAQAVGLAHHVAHAPGLAHGNWSLDHEADGSDCRLVDQLAHADALCGAAAPVLPALAAADSVVPLPAPATPAAPAAAYQARAPPSA